MKGIKKIILRNADILNDQQMKSIFGGSGSSGSSSGSGHDYCNDICKKNSDCGGSCTQCVEVPNWSGINICSV